MRPSETRMYDLLQCTQEWTIPYSQIYVEGELCCTNNSKAKYYALLQTITCPKKERHHLCTVLKRQWKSNVDVLKLLEVRVPFLHSFSTAVDKDRKESGGMHNNVNQNNPSAQRLSQVKFVTKSWLFLPMCVRSFHWYKLWNQWWYRRYGL